MKGSVIMYNEFENKQINGYTYASRFIASWVRVGGTLSMYDGGSYDFEDWLKSLGLSEEDINHIMHLAKNGKMELESSARSFIKNIKK